MKYDTVYLKRYDAVDLAERYQAYYVTPVDWDMLTCIWQEMQSNGVVPQYSEPEFTALVKLWRKDFDLHDLRVRLDYPGDYDLSYLVDHVTEHDGRGNLVWRLLTKERFNNICADARWITFTPRPCRDA